MHFLADLSSGFCQNPDVSSLAPVSRRQLERRLSFPVPQTTAMAPGVSPAFKIMKYSKFLYSSSLKCVKIKFSNVYSI